MKEKGRFWFQTFETSFSFSIIADAENHSVFSTYDLGGLRLAGSRGDGAYRRDGGDKINVSAKNCRSVDTRQPRGESIVGRATIDQGASKIAYA